MTIIELSENKWLDISNLVMYYYERGCKELHISKDGVRTVNLKDDEALTIIGILQQKKIN